MGFGLQPPSSRAGLPPKKLTNRCAAYLGQMIARGNEKPLSRLRNFKLHKILHINSVYLSFSPLRITELMLW